MGFEADFLGSEVEARGAVEAIAVEQGHGRHAAGGANRDQVLGQSGAFEEAEGGAGVEFDVQVLSSQFSVLSSQQDLSPQRHRDTERTQSRFCLCESVAKLRTEDPELRIETQVRTTAEN